MGSKTGIAAVDLFKDRKPGDWLYCTHCQRAYKAGEYREFQGFQLCPYAGCSGDTVLNAWAWERVRGIHPEYPEEPERDVVYPL